MIEADDYFWALTDLFGAYWTRKGIKLARIQTPFGYTIRASCTNFSTTTPFRQLAYQCLRDLYRMNLLRPHHAPPVSTATVVPL